MAPNQAKRAVKGGRHQNIKKKIRTSVHFKLPKTLKLARNPKVPRKSTTKRPTLDKFSIVRYPLTTESAMSLFSKNFQLDHA